MPRSPAPTRTDASASPRSTLVRVPAHATASDEKQASLIVQSRHHICLILNKNALLSLNVFAFLSTRQHEGCKLCIKNNRAIFMRVEADVFLRGSRQSLLRCQTWSTGGARDGATRQGRRRRRRILQTALLPPPSTGPKRERQTGLALSVLAKLGVCAVGGGRPASPELGPHGSSS